MKIKYESVESKSFKSKRFKIVLKKHINENDWDRCRWIEKTDINFNINKFVKLLNKKGYHAYSYKCKGNLKYAIYENKIRKRRVKKF